MAFYFFTVVVPAETMLVGKRLEDAIQPYQPVGVRVKNFLDGKPDPEKPFRGCVDRGRFKLHRRIGYRNSFLPVIRGKIEAHSGGSTVHVWMTLNFFTMIFMAVWFAFTGHGIAKALLGSVSV